MSDVLADPAPVATAAPDPELTAQLRGYCYSNRPINQCPQAWQAIITVARATMRGVVGMATLTALVADQFGDAVDAAALAFAGPPAGTFLLDVRDDSVVATATDTAFGIPDDCFRWSLDTAPDILGSSARGPVFTVVPPDRRPRWARVRFELVVGGAVYRDAQSATYPVGYPLLQSIEPARAVLGSPEFTLHFYGLGFDPAAEVIWNGGAETTTFIDSTHLTIEVDPTTAVVFVSVPVHVHNPAGDSDPAWFSFVHEGQLDLPPTIY